MVLARLSKAQMIDSISPGFRNKELPVPEPGATSYMMSKDAYLTDGRGHNPAHLMFYAPPLDGKAWGRGSAEITGNADSTIQSRSTDRHVYRSRGQMVRQIHCAGYVRPFLEEAANSSVPLRVAASRSQIATRGIPS